MNVIKNIPYASNPRCRLDIYKPQLTGTKVPVLLVIHGGAWMIGDKDKNRTVCHAIAKAGMVAVSPNYQLSDLPIGTIRQTLWWISICIPIILLLIGSKPMVIVLCIVVLFAVWFIFTTWVNMVTPKIPSDLTYPSHIGDIEQSLTWVEERISNYGGDPNCIIILGHSAGAHLASLLSIRRETYPNSPIRGVICISGVYSHHRLKQITCGEWLVSCAFGKQDDYLTYFPLYSVNSNLPPHYLINATWDIGLIKHTWDMVSTLKTHGVYVRFGYFNGTHFSIMKNWDNEVNSNVWNEIHSFIEEVVSFYRET